MTQIVRASQPNVLRRVYDAIAGKPASKSDGWANCLTGAGTWGRDKSRHTFMEPVWSLQWGQLESLYYGDWISANIVDSRPKEYFRRGFTLKGGDDDLTKALAALGAETKFRQAATWARLYGGAGLVCAVDDGLTVDQPVNLARSRGVKWMNVVDSRYLRPVDYYDDPSLAQFGMPRTYNVTPALGQTGIDQIIHESRIIRFVGTEVDAVTSRRLGGWAYSALQRPYDVIRRMAQTFQSAGQLMYDVGQGVLKVSNLFEKLTGPSAAAVLDRIAQADMARWSGKSIAIDSEGEDFTRTATPLAGVPEMMDRIFLELGGAARTPLTKIFGRSPAGQNATGESDERMWYEEIGNEQVNEIEPGLVQLLMMLTAGRWDGGVEWIGLERPNDLIDAQVKTERAKYWQILEDVGSVSGEQVALVELLGKPVEDVLDEDVLLELVEEEYKLAKDPPPTPAPPMVTGVPITTGTNLLSAAAKGETPAAPVGAKPPPPLPPKG